jgi:hypothetical protein
VRLAAPLLSGLLFAVGLGVAGMTLPENVLAFRTRARTQR